jgi:hypothetical protein
MLQAVALPPGGVAVKLLHAVPTIVTCAEPEAPALRLAAITDALWVCLSDA